MAPNPKHPRPPRKSNSGGGPRRGRPRKEEEEDKKRTSMPLPSSLLDTTITDGEEYRPGTGAPAEGQAVAARAFARAGMGGRYSLVKMMMPGCPQVSGLGAGSPSPRVMFSRMAASGV